MKKKLRNKGWTDEEISYYNECQEGLYYTDIFLHEGTIKILLHKFISILDNFDLNDVAREILNRIIIQIFQTQFSDIVTNIHVRYTKYLKKKRKNIIMIKSIILNIIRDLNLTHLIILIN